jgi:hypothetical protein
MNYGINKIMLLNTAGYQLGIFPLNAPCSIYGENGKGKSTILNALQFIFISNLNEMDFGDKSISQSKEFYFSENAYICYEVSTKHGDFVIGIVGKGASESFRHEYFLYEGKLNPEDYNVRNTVVGFQNFQKHMQSLGYMIHYGIEFKTLRASMIEDPQNNHKCPTVGLVPLKQKSQYPVFQRLYKNLLKLSKVTTKDLKQDILQVFAIEMGNSKIDYVDVYRKAFAEYEQLRKEYYAYLNAKQDIKKLAECLTDWRKTMGFVEKIYPFLNQSIESWHIHYEEEIQKFDEQIEQLERQSQSVNETLKAVMKERADIEVQIREHDRWFSRFDELKQRFELVSKQDIENQIKQLQAEYDKLSEIIGISQFNSLLVINRDITNKKDELHKIITALSAKQTLGEALVEEYGAEKITWLGHLINPKLFMESVDLDSQTINIKDKNMTLQEIGIFLQRFNHQKFDGYGYEIYLNKLQGYNAQLVVSRADLEQQKDAIETELEELNKNKEELLKIEENKQKRANIAETKKQKEKDLEAYEEYAEALNSFLTKQKEYDNLLKIQTDLEQKQDTIVKNALQYQNDIAERKREKLGFVDKFNRIKKERDSLPQNPVSYPQYATPCYEIFSDSYEFVEDNLQNYKKAVTNWYQKEKECQQLYYIIKNRGIFKFDKIENSIERYLKLIEESEEQKLEVLLRNTKRKSIKSLASHLQGMLNDYQRLEKEIRNFNTSINRKPISNLKSFKVTLQPENKLIKDIQQIAKTSDEIEQQGDIQDMFVLKDQSNLSEEQANEAADNINKHATDQNKELGVADLFNLQFELEDNHGKHVHTKLDAAGSTGTIATIKVLVNLFLMSHLFNSKANQDIKHIFCLDEAAKVDESNLSNLIETVNDLGFIPLFASVKPETTAEYFIDLNHADQRAKQQYQSKMIITEQMWDKKSYGINSPTSEMVKKTSSE